MSSALYFLGGLSFYFVLSRIDAVLRRMSARAPHKFIVVYDQNLFGPGSKEKMLACFNSWRDVAVLLMGARQLEQPFVIFRLDMAPSIEEIKVVVEDQVAKGSERVN